MKLIYTYVILIIAKLKISDICYATRVKLTHTWPSRILNLLRACARDHRRVVH